LSENEHRKVLLGSNGAAIEWVAEYVESIGDDPDAIAVGGDSAGGNLPAAVSLLARDRDGPELVH